MMIFKDSTGKYSMGRVISLCAFIVATIYLFYSKFRNGNGDIGNNDSMFVIWTYGIAIGGKAVQTFGELRNATPKN